MAWPSGKRFLTVHGDTGIPRCYLQDYPGSTGRRDEVYQRLVELQLLEPGIDWDQVRGGRQFRRSLAALGDEEFSPLLTILQRALSDP